MVFKVKVSLWKENKKKILALFRCKKKRDLALPTTKSVAHESP